MRKRRRRQEDESRREKEKTNDFIGRFLIQYYFSKRSEASFSFYHFPTFLSLLFVFLFLLISRNFHLIYANLKAVIKILGRPSFLSYIWRIAREILAASSVTESKLKFIRLCSK